jgi:two-component system nitrogen regulation response regulator GlnG
MLRSGDSTGPGPDAREAPDGVPVLLIEADRLLRWSLCERLRAAGHAVRPAGSAAEARDLADPQVRVVLLDPRLPDGDGIDLIPELLARTGGARIALLAASLDGEAAAQAAAAGARWALLRPFSTRELLDLLARLSAPAPQSPGGPPDPARPSPGAPRDLDLPDAPEA